MVWKFEASFNCVERKRNVDVDTMNCVILNGVVNDERRNNNFLILQSVNNYSISK